MWNMFWYLLIIFRYSTNAIYGIKDIVNIIEILWTTVLITTISFYLIVEKDNNHIKIYASSAI